MQQTVEAWSTLESYVPHRIRNLGISNCSLAVLKYLYIAPAITIKPCVVQNRFHAGSAFDVSLRTFCRANKLVYESFWTLSANQYMERSALSLVGLVAEKAHISPAAALYCLVMGLEGLRS